MKKRTKALVGLVLLLGLTQTVSAKEMMLKNDGYLFEKETKKIIFPQDEKFFDVGEFNEDKEMEGYNVNYKGKKYLVLKKYFIEPELYSEYLEKYKVKQQASNNDSVYDYVGFTNTNQYIKEIIDNFYTSGTSDLEQIQDVMVYLKMLNLRYDLNSRNSQFNTIEYGYTACNGITYLQKLLLDKTNLKYRIVLENPANYERKEQDPVSPGHIYCEVQINGKWHAFDATELLKKERANENITYENAKNAIKHLLNNSLSREVDYSNKHSGYFAIAIDPNYPDVISRVSGTYRNNHKIEDNGFNAWFPSKTLNQFQKEFE